MKIPDELSHVLTSSPDTVSGAVCFKDTRVPVTTLFDYIASGESLDEFLIGFPGVSREQAIAVLRWQSKESRRLLDQDIVA